ncbi:MAG: hypothetical protein ABI592_01165 [Acidobacteriota bacterium]
MDKAMKDAIRRLAAAGGRARAEKHTKKQLSEWGKLGGRPRTKKKATKKAAK